MYLYQKLERYGVFSSYSKFGISENVLTKCENHILLLICEFLASPSLQYFSIFAHMYRRVLIITYYWPPAGGGGVQRWLKFAKYMPQCGIIPVIYTPSNADYPIIDKTLAADIPPEVEMLYRPIIEPYRLFRKLSRQKKGKISAGLIQNKENQGVVQKFLTWLRGNFFIPDARITWVNPSVAFLEDYLLYNPVDAIITTGPPHSMHLIGMELQKRMGIRWIADFRDQWLKMDNKEHFKLSFASMRKHEALERKVVQQADEVICVSWTAANEYAKLRGKPVHTITNGYDHEDFEKRYERRGDYYIIGHYGTLGADRDHPEFWQRLQEEQSHPILGHKTVLELIGPTDEQILNKAIALMGRERVWQQDYLPHLEVLKHMQEASVLVLLVNRNESAPGRIPGKVFEYLACERPIWLYGGEGGDVEKVVTEASGASFTRVFLTIRLMIILYNENCNYNWRKTKLHESRKTNQSNAKWWKV